MPFQAILFDGSIPAYQRIAPEVKRLQALGLSLRAVARHLGLSKKPVVMALAWIKARNQEIS